ncbi:MAG TPA: hypothetical protein VNT76_00455 [Candidatus Binatus sp.]|nr:hypothetical protein [Candidatus Binatus sp.]
MTQKIRRNVFTIVAALVLACGADQAFAQGERFEITSIKAVRPTLVNTVAALQAGDVARAKAAFEAYDSAWNGIEVYVNVRSKPMYEILEHEFQARITKALDAPNPNVAPLLADAQAMLAKFDETVALIAPMAPLNAFYDEIARLRIVRAHLREVPPALKVGDFAKARKSFQNFDDNWDSIEDLIKARNADSYVAIEKGMIAIEKALVPDKPDVAQVTAMVNEIMRLYNAALAEIAKDARARQ